MPTASAAPSAGCPIAASISWQPGAVLAGGTPGRADGVSGVACRLRAAWGRSEHAGIAGLDTRLMDQIGAYKCDPYGGRSLCQEHYSYDARREHRQRSSSICYQPSGSPPGQRQQTTPPLLEAGYADTG